MLELPADQPLALVAVRLCDVAPDGIVAAREPWPAQPHPPRRARAPRARLGRRAHDACACELGAIGAGDPGRAPAAARASRRLLAVDLALARARRAHPAHSRREPARAAGAAAGRRARPSRAPFAEPETGAPLPVEAVPASTARRSRARATSRRAAPRCVSTATTRPSASSSRASRSSTSCTTRTRSSTVNRSRRLAVPLDDVRRARRLAHARRGHEHDDGIAEAFLVTTRSRHTKASPRFARSTERRSRVTWCSERARSDDAMTDTGTGRRADGGRSAGEVAEGVTLVKNMRVQMRDGIRLAADLYLPDDALEAGRPVSGGHGLHPVPQGRGRSRGSPPLRVPAAARLHRRPRRHPRHRRLGGREHRRVPAAGAARRRRRRRVARRAAVVRRPRRT